MTSVPDDDAAGALARRLRESREFLNLSQQFVSDQTGIPRSAVSDMERGLRRVDSLELKRLADLYRMPVTYFIGEDQTDDVAAAPQDPTVLALARATGEMDAQGRNEVLRFALFLSNYQKRGGDAP